MQTRAHLIHGVLAIATVGLLGPGCQPAGDAAATCDDLRAVMAACYPDLPPDASCSEQTIAAYSPEDLAALDCNDIDDAGKADLFSAGGCGEGEHVCGWMFCCEDDYAMHWTPSAGDWGFVPRVEAYQDATPQWVLDELWSATDEELLDAVSVTFEQEVDDGLGAGPRELAVEVTQGLVPVDFETFLSRFSPDTWGVNLDHYLGGEVLVVERDGEGRVVRQAERMVLSPFPCDAESPLSNQDMTKVEEIVWTADEVTVYWRVMFSDNGSTETDMGRVAFARSGDETLVTFHSAHRLRTAIGTVLPNALVQLTLAPFFSDHVREYRELVTGQR